MSADRPLWDTRLKAKQALTAQQLPHRIRMHDPWITPYE